MSSSGIVRSNDRMPASTCTTGRSCLGRSQRARQRRVGVAVDEHRVGAKLCQQRLERRQHAGRLRRVAPARDLQLAVRARQAELAEEHPRQRVVVVLAGVDQQLLVLGAQRTRYRRGLHELGPVADDGHDPHARKPRWRRAGAGANLRAVSGAARDPEPRRDRARAFAAARSRRTGRSADHGLLPRAGRSGRAREATAGVLRGRSRVRGAAAVRTNSSPPWLERALAEFRVLMLDQRGTGRSTPVTHAPAGRARRSRPSYLLALPRRLDRRRRRGDSARARGRALERARAELRRLLRDALPVGRTRQP